MSRRVDAPRRVAVVGTGISGLLAARLLATRHDVTVLEAAPRLGGHTHTHDVEWDGERHAIDTGFIVFNERNYPHFSRMLELLDVASQPSDMSFSVRCDRTGLEYNGTSLDTLFAQRRNLVRPAFWWMIREILRFNREAPRLLEQPDDGLTLGEYLREHRYARGFVDHYVVPMGAAIWSAEPRRMLEFPASTFVRFFQNHGMLTVDDRPTWRTVTGGSRTYVNALIAPLRERVRSASPVTAITRDADGVTLAVAGRPERYDEVVVATHSDQALRALTDATTAEREVLGAIPYQENEAVLHLDTRQLPRRRKAWAAWNYHVPREPRARLAVTYDMNILQRLDARETFCVTLNPAAPVAADRVIKRMVYHHPIFTVDGIAAQRRRTEISGVRRTWYCGAYWGYGFHEDGVRSALDVARALGVERGIEAVADTPLARPPARAAG